MSYSFDPILFQNQFSKLKNDEFNKAALELFYFQFENNVVYKKYCNYINIDPLQIKSLEMIPFLPISLFKTHKIKTTNFRAKLKFSSSGTSSSTKSIHYVKEIDIYKKSFLKTFIKFYGNINEYRILALLPSYLERDNSSLVYMVNDLIKKSGYKESGFFLNNLEELNNTLNELAITKQKVILMGVSFGLLDFIDSFKPKKNPKLIVMETGGMKGRRKELIREELHQLLCNSFQTKTIHSEYGMTELLSQAYSKGNGIFYCPSWMKVMIRKIDDPFSYTKIGKTGGINIIDLANIYSCAFIQTDDLGRYANERGFEVLGRFDSSEARGCNLLIA